MQITLLGSENSASPALHLLLCLFPLSLDSHCHPRHGLLSAFCILLASHEMFCLELVWTPAEWCLHSPLTSTFCGPRLRPPRPAQTGGQRCCAALPVFSRMDRWGGQAAMGAPWYLRCVHPVSPCARWPGWAQCVCFRLAWKQAYQNVKHLSLSFPWNTNPRPWVLDWEAPHN